MKPVRKTMNGKKPEGAVFVDHPSKWGNTFDYKSYPGNQLEQLCSAAEDFEKGLTPSFKRMIRDELKGKDLCCRCPEGAYCHADVLLKIANGPGRNWSGHDKQVPLKVTFQPHYAALLKAISKESGRSYREVIEHALEQVYGA